IAVSLGASAAPVSLATVSMVMASGGGETLSAASPSRASPAASDAASAAIPQSPLGRNRHPRPGMHMSVVQATLSLQTSMAVPGAHLPALQKSPIVHG